MTKETLERAKELEQEISVLRNKIETVEDIICHEQERNEKGEKPGELRYTSRGKVETSRVVYPSGVVHIFKTINVLELLKIEKVRLNQKLIELEEEFREL